MYSPELKSYIASVIEASQSISTDRNDLLRPLIDYLTTHKQGCQLTFICTHNSRRSHFGQIWAHTAARHFGLSNVNTYSGGTEATAFHPNAIAALHRAGVRVESAASPINPKSKIMFGESVEAMDVFSKTYDHPINPQRDFAAIMTCSEADRDCPIVIGADKKIPLHYTDPKVSDGTPSQEKTYDARCFQIASEMFYVFGKAVS